MADKSNKGIGFIIGGIKGFADIQAEKAKIAGDVMVNRLKEQDNWFYKMKEMKQKQETEMSDWKNKMEAIKQYNESLRQNKPIAMQPRLPNSPTMGSTQGMGGVTTQETPQDNADVFSMPIQPEARMSPTGAPTLHYPDRKEFIFNKIQEKKAQNKPLNNLEKKFEENYLGLKTEAEKTAENKGLSIETGGKLAMVKQAKKDIQEARQMLFPDGTPKSFSRSRAFVSNLPGSRAPIIGGIIPQSMPFNEMGQKIYSRLQNAVAAKLRVETGAQANPSEVENILARFGVTSFSDPKAAWDAIKRLEEFMDTTIDITDPGQKFASAGGQNTLSELAKQPKFKPGDTIQGKDGKTYRVIGGNPDDPDVEEVK